MGSMLLNEILSKPTDYMVIADTATYFATSAKIGGRKIIFNAVKEGKKPWDISFQESKIVDGKITNTMKATGSGNELEVFAMIKASLLQFIKQYDPESMTFDAHKGEKTADDERNVRADLYERLLKRFKIPGYTVERETRTRGDSFTITKDKHAAY
jgi:hypothetical protein